MKRILALLLAAIMAFALVACANQPEEQETNAPTAQQTNGTEPTNQTDPTQGSEEPDDDYEEYVKISSKSIYVNFKSGRRDNVKSSSIVFHGETTNLVALSYDKGAGFVGTSADAFTLINDGRILKNISMYTDADFYDDIKYIMEIKTTENVKINDYDMQKFTANVMSSNDRNCYVYGYAFVIEGTPCVLAGFVLSEDQEQSLINAINIEVDTMVKTVRTEF